MHLNPTTNLEIQKAVENIPRSEKLHLWQTTLIWPATKTTQYTIEEQTRQRLRILFPTLSQNAIETPITIWNQTLENSLWETPATATRKHANA